MPEITRQKSSGALVFKPTLQEQTLVDTQKALDQKVEALDSKLQEVDLILKKLRKEGISDNSKDVL